MKKLILLLLFIPLVFSCSNEEPVKYTLSTSSYPIDAGTVIPSTGEFDEGEEITIVANPKIEFNFDKWTGSATGDSNPLKIIMDNNKTITANYIPKIPSRARYELSEVWLGKIVIPKGDYPVGYNTTYRGRNYYNAYSHKLRMSSGHHYSVDSLIVDFSKIDYGGDWGGHRTKDLRLFIPSSGTSAKVYTPKKIGYIKVIGDTLNKRLFWEFRKWKLPILYGDSNIDFSDLIYNGNSIWTTPTKIKNDSEYVYFKKEDVAKNVFFREIPFDANGNQGDWKVGDTIGFGDGSYKIHSIQYLYN